MTGTTDFTSLDLGSSICDIGNNNNARLYGGVSLKELMMSSV